MQTWRGIIRSAVVWTLVVMLTIDTASACRLFARRSCYRTCCTPCYFYEVESPCGTPCAAPPQCGTGNIDLGTTASPSQATPAENPSAADDLSGKSVEMLPAQSSETPDADEAVDESAETKPAEEPGAADDLFSEPAETEPVQPPTTPSADDLFGEPAETKPAEQPGTSDDLFGEPQIEPQNPGAQQSDSEVFGDPVEMLPADTDDDIFGTPGEKQPEENQPAEGADDLFGVPADKATDGSPAQDDLFDTPGVGPVETQPAEASDEIFGGFDDQNADDAGVFSEPGTGSGDLFGGPRPQEEAPTQPADSPAGDEGDLFGPLDPDKETRSGSAQPSAQLSVGRIVRTTDPGGFTSHEFRNFVDNTGIYRCRGRLVGVWGDQVQLLKDNGRTATFPMRRLGAVDRAFVEEQLAARRDPSGVRTASN